jgi:hypothetical protein
MQCSSLRPLRSDPRGHATSIPTNSTVGKLARDRSGRVVVGSGRRAGIERVWGFVQRLLPNAPCRSAGSNCGGVVPSAAYR